PIWLCLPTWSAARNFCRWICPPAFSYLPLERRSLFICCCAPVPSTNVIFLKITPNGSYRKPRPYAKVRYPDRYRRAESGHSQGTDYSPGGQQRLRQKHPAQIVCPADPTVAGVGPAQRQRYPSPLHGISRTRTGYFAAEPCGARRPVRLSIGAPGTIPSPDLAAAMVKGRRGDRNAGAGTNGTDRVSGQA